MRSAAMPSPGLPRVLVASRAIHSAWLRPATANRAPVFAMIGAASGPEPTSTSSPPASNAPMSGTSGVTWPAPGVDTTKIFMIAATYSAESQNIPTAPPPESEADSKTRSPTSAPLSLAAMEWAFGVPRRRVSAVVGRARSPIQTAWKMTVEEPAPVSIW